MDKHLSTCTQAQRQRVLKLLLERPHSTFEFRERYSVMMPAARIKELRNLGCVITTHLSNLADREGRVHIRVATYALIRLPSIGEVTA